LADLAAFSAVFDQLQIRSGGAIFVFEGFRSCEDGTLIKACLTLYFAS